MGQLRCFRIDGNLQDFSIFKWYGSNAALYIACVGREFAVFVLVFGGLDNGNNYPPAL